MAREGTRSQTGSATPRVFYTIDTAPSIVRKKSAKSAKTKAKAVPVPAAKPTGVAKKKAAAKPVKREAKVAVAAKPGKKAAPKAASDKAAKKAAAAANSAEKPKPAAVSE